MDKPPPYTAADAFIAALDWWHEAGVDGDFADTPRNWLERPAQENGEPQADPTATQAGPKPAATVPPLGGDRGNWPQTLADFAPWWCSTVETPGHAPRVPPRGTAGAELMIVVPMPEEGDRESLLSGPQGAMIGRMLGAMEIGEERAYLASALPGHARHPDWQALAERGLGEVLRLHIALAAPRLLLVLGRKMLPLFGHDPAQGGAIAGQIALEDVAVPTLAAVGPETLLDEPRFRRTLWRAWLDWTKGTA